MRERARSLILFRIAGPVEQPPKVRNLNYLDLEFTLSVYNNVTAPKIYSKKGFRSLIVDRKSP